MKHLLLASVSIALAACSQSDFQTTSGAAYLANGQITDPDVRRLASYEPTLSLPGRVGVVRYVYGRIGTMPAAEREILETALGADLGELVFLSEIDTGYQRVSPAENHTNIRSTAATRHLDYLLLLDYDPTRNIVETLFLDVRSGYPYASHDILLEGRGRSNLFGNALRNVARQDRATQRMAERMAPQIAAFMDGLRGERNF